MERGAKSITVSFVGRSTNLPPPAYLHSYLGVGKALPMAYSTVTIVAGINVASPIH
jgi:hypothetical protein